jgi:hypothetical protein
MLRKEWRERDSEEREQEKNGREQKITKCSQDRHRPTLPTVSWQVQGVW